MLQKCIILGVSITNERKEKILEYLIDRLHTASDKISIITPNPEMLVYAQKHEAYKKMLNSADIALPDGVGLFFASTFMGKPLKERITGVDFIDELCRTTSEKPLSMGFLGGKDGVAKKAAECLLQKYPWIKVGFAGSEWNESDFLFKEKHQVASSKYQDKKQGNLHDTNYIIPDTTIDILFVAYGVPKQEEWIYEHLHKIPVKAAMGVGGSFDFISGVVPRAPFLIRFLGFEWLFRLIVQPWRWRRQLALLEFIFMISKDYFS